MTCPTKERAHTATSCPLAVLRARQNPIDTEVTILPASSKPFAYYCGPALVLLALLGCDAGEGPQNADLEHGVTEPHLRQVLSIATVESEIGDPLIFEPRAVAGLPNGSLIVLDLESPRVVVLGRDGSVSARFGRSGSGPGEIRGSWAALWGDSAGTLWVADPSNRRVSQYTDTGELLSERRLALGEREGVAAWLPIPNTERLLVQRWQASQGESGTNFVDAVADVDVATGEMHTLVNLPPRHAGAGQGRILFAPISLWCVLPGGKVVEGRSDSAVLRVHSPESPEPALITLPFSVRPVTEQLEKEILQEAQELGIVSQRQAVAPNLPLAVRLLPVNDTLFALQHTRRSTPEEIAPLGENQIGWTLVTTRGAVITTLVFPTSFSPHWSWDQRVVGVSRDSLGIARIEEYLIEL